MTTSTSQTGTLAGAGPLADTTDQIADQAKTNVAQVKSRISEQARSSVQQAKDRAGTAFTERKERLSGQITGVAGAVRRATEQLRDEGHGQIAGYAESLAASADRASSYLRDADVYRMRSDLEDFARRQPVLVVGGALALGVLAARFLRSSGRRPNRFGNTDGALSDSPGRMDPPGTDPQRFGMKDIGGLDGVR